MMTREEAEKELIAMLEEAEGGPSYSIEEVDAYMRELLHPKNQIYQVIHMVSLSGSSLSVRGSRSNPKALSLSWVTSD